ncbi:hypothetical protein QZJ86_20830 [Methylomonas montana]|uniref:hypothetical protein n=1 Tax=Methylomonas montana TaxID=3058963 RepID=UPI00265A64DD|nr:hypothetical protein [Methylomonas montana]WKJ90423.1 hypothetical protein QZJ86_20830 [Methylomonas montana]
MPKKIQLWSLICIGLITTAAQSAKIPAANQLFQESMVSKTLNEYDNPGTALIVSILIGAVYGWYWLRNRA